LERYGSEIPPELPLGATKIPIALFGAKDDNCVNIGDTRALRDQL
jgi:hypothetical protein